MQYALTRSLLGVLTLLLPLGCSSGSASGGSDDTAVGGGGAIGSGGAAIVGAGGGSASGVGGGVSVSGSGGTIATGTWHSVVSAAVTEAMLQQEYAAWKASFVQTCANGSAVVIKDGGQVVSEGIAYGMLLAAAMADRELFDGLWQFYGEHLDANGLMNWSMGVCDAPGNNNSNAATDAELDATMALLQANAVWPDGGYLAQAQSLAALILEHEVDAGCTGGPVLKPGDVWGGCSDANSETRINPSYFAPGYYSAFATHFPEQAANWNALLDHSYDLYAIYQARMTGLVPDWSDYDGADWYGSGYWYDACRAPWRVATHYAWTGDARALDVITRFTTWVESNGGLPGAAQANNSAFVGAFALAASYDQVKFDNAVAAWLGAGGDDTPYFQGTLRVIYLLLAGGRFASTF